MAVHINPRGDANLICIYADISPLLVIDKNQFSPFRSDSHVILPIRFVTQNVTHFEIQAK